MLALIFLPSLARRIGAFNLFRTVMSATLSVVVPVFAIVILGWLGGRLRLAGPAAAEGLAGFVFTFAIPCLMFRTITGAPAPEENPWYYWAAYFAGVAVVWFLATFISRKFFEIPAPEGAIIGFSTGQANTVLVGIPLILRTYGDTGATPLALLVAIHLPITMTAATLLVERSLGGTTGLLDIGRKVIANPMMIGIACGVVMRVIGLPVPEPVQATVKMIGDAAAPCALFTLGLALNRHGLGADIRLLGILAALKVALHPAIVFVLGHFVFGLPPVWVGVAVLFAACPSGINGYLLAERYKKGVGLISGSVMTSTLMSLVSMTFWVWLVTRY